MERMLSRDSRLYSITYLNDVDILSSYLVDE
jgi:hypothetical protein